MAAKQFCFIYVTAKNVEEAEKLGRAAVEKKLAACANIFPQMRSIYWWQGKIDTSDEAVLILKTKTTHYKKVEKFIVDNHSYETACVLRLPLDGGSKPYLKWLTESLLG